MCHYIQIRTQNMETMPSTTFTVRVEAEVKERLEKLAKSTGRTRSFLSAEALNAYLEVNEWQVAGVKRAMASLDRGDGVPHQEVKDWVSSWGGKRERSAPKHGRYEQHLGGPALRPSRSIASRRSQYLAQDMIWPETCMLWRGSRPQCKLPAYPLSWDGNADSRHQTRYDLSLYPAGRIR